MFTGWTVNIESFSDLSKLEFIRVEDGQAILGLSQEADYKTPPTPITGLFAEDKLKSKSSFLKYTENIQTALAFWKTNRLLRELS